MSTFSFPLILIVLNFDKARDERANGKQATEPAGRPEKQARRKSPKTN